MRIYPSSSVLNIDIRATKNVPTKGKIPCGECISSLLFKTAKMESGAEWVISGALRVINLCMCVPSFFDACHDGLALHIFSGNLNRFHILLETQLLRLNHRYYDRTQWKTRKKKNQNNLASKIPISFKLLFTLFSDLWQ